MDPDWWGCHVRKAWAERKQMEDFFFFGLRWAKEKQVVIGTLSAALCGPGFLRMDRRLEVYSWHCKITASKTITLHPNEFSALSLLSPSLSFSFTDRWNNLKPDASRIYKKEMKFISKFVLIFISRKKKILFLVILILWWCYINKEFFVGQSNIAMKVETS